MGSGGGGNSQPMFTPPPAPTPTSEQYMVNGQLQSNRLYDPNTKMYTDNSFQTPQQQQTTDFANQSIADLLPKAANAVNLSDDQLNQYAANYAQPQIDALTNSYNQAKGAASSQASSQGMQNSVGFDQYLANQLEKNKAQGLADIQANAQTMKYQLPDQILQPYTNLFNLYNGALNGQQATQAQNLSPSFSGSNASNNFDLQNYQNQLNAFNSDPINRIGSRVGSGFLGFLGI